MRILAAMKELRFRRAKLWAIDKAAGRIGYSMYENKSSRSAGLRTLLDFERVNGIEFNPFNNDHVLAVSDMARFGSILRKAEITMRRCEHLEGRQC